MPALLLLGLGVSLPWARPASAEEEAPGLRLVAHAPTETPVVDGLLTEWDLEDADGWTILERVDQVIEDRRSDWKGTADLSGRFRVRADREALYLAIRVTDDAAFHPGLPWWHGDSVELFLDTRVGGAVEGTEDATAPQAPAPRRFRAGSWQIFLMPRNPELAWGVAYQGLYHRFDDGGLKGVKLAHRERDRTHPEGAGYDLEVRLPLSGFGLGGGAPTEIGFAIALNDADDGPSDPGTYMTWDGEVLYQRLDHFGVLELPARAPRTAAVESTGPSVLWIGLAVLLAVLAILLLAGPGAQALARLGPAPKLVGLALTGLLAIVFAVDASRTATRAERLVRRELEGLATRAEEVAAEASAIGALPTDDEEARADVLERLLRGTPVPCVLPPQDVVFVPLVEPEVAAARAHRGYRLPLDRRHEMRLPEPIPRGASLEVHVEVGPYPARGGETESPVSLGTLQTRGEDGTASARVEILVVPSGEVQQVATLDDLADADATVLEFVPRAGAPPAILRGIHAVRKSPAVRTPLVLSTKTADGIPILGGPSAPDLGLTLEAGGSATVVLPYLLGADRLWVVMTARDAFPKTLGDATLAQFEITYDVEDENGETTTTTDVRNGEHVVGETLPAGIQRPPDMASRVAYRWVDIRGQAHAHDALAVTVDPTRHARELTIRCPRGGGPFRVTAATLLRATEPAKGSILRCIPGGTDGADHIYVKDPVPAFQQRLGSGGPDASPSVRIERALGPEIRPTAVVLSAPLPEAVAVKRERTRIALLTCLAVALVLLAFLAADAVERLRRLTWRLAFAVLVAALLPLGATIWLVDRTTHDRLEAEHAARARTVLATVETALREAQRRTLDDAWNLSRHLAAEPSPTPPDRVASLVGLYRGGALPDGTASLALVSETDRPTLAVPGDKPEARLLGPRWLTERSHHNGLHVSPWDGLLLVGSSRSGSDDRWVRVALGVRVDDAFLNEEVGGAAPDPDAAVALLDASGTPLASAGSGGADFGAALSRHVGDLAPDTRLIHRVDPQGPEGRPRLAVLARLDTQGDPRDAPWLAVGLDRTAIEQALMEQREGLAWLALFGVVLIVGVASLTARRIADPIKGLVRVTEAVRRGEFEVTVPPAGTDEVGELTIAFDQMRHDLKHRVADLDLLRRAQTELAGSLDYGRRSATVVDLLRSVFDPDAVVLVDATSPEGPLAIAAEHGRSSAFADRSFRGQPGGWLVAALQQDEPLEIDAPGEDARVAAEGPLGARLVEERPAWLALPLRAGGETAGLVVMAYDDPERLPRGAARHLLEPLAGVCALALNNARLYRLAALDEGTGLPGATAFTSALRTDVERATGDGPPIVLLRIGLDHHEHVTLRRGVELARELVRALALALREVVGDLSRLGRMRTDELAVRLPGASRAEALALAEKIRERLARVEVVPEEGGEAVTSTVTVGTARGPDDATSMEFLLDAAGRALAAARREGGDRVEDAARLDAGLVDLPPYEEGTIVRSEKMVRVVEAARRAARTDTSILITGETGTGKEVVANLIHRRSARSERPFVKVNCAAFPETLLESELFGHERGAFTGAERRREGRFELADGGTLFLDEIAEMALSAQVKLLRVLQERQFTRLGGTRTVSVDVRIIAATNRDLEARVEDGSFREDLYYRLNVIRLEIPPLRERREEIPLLVEAFLKDAVRRTGRGPGGLAAGAMDVLYRHPWPGNVRELKNVIERCAVLCDAEEVGPEHLRLDGSRAQGTAAPRGAPRDDLNDRQKQLLDYLARHGRCTNREYYEMTGTSPRTGLRDLQDLMARDLLLREGKRRGAVYRLP